MYEWAFYFTAIGTSNISWTCPLRGGSLFVRLLLDYGERKTDHPENSSSRLSGLRADPPTACLCEESGPSDDRMPHRRSRRPHPGLSRRARRKSVVQLLPT